MHVIKEPNELPKLTAIRADKYKPLCPNPLNLTEVIYGIKLDKINYKPVRMKDCQ